MPYLIKPVSNGFKVCLKRNPKKCFSNKPLSKSKAIKQEKAIILSELSRKKIGGSNFIGGIRKTEGKPMSDIDIKRYLPSAQIILYPELSKYESIDELLPNDKSYCIILYEDKLNSGHWCCVLKFNDIYEYFDSFGKTIDNPLKNWLSKGQRIKLDENVFYLSNLLNQTDKEVIYNKIDFQVDNPSIQTCGRFCIHRILMMLKGMNLQEYQRYMKQRKSEEHLTYDELVSKLTP